MTMKGGAPIPRRVFDLCPLPLGGEGEELEKGAAPLFDTPKGQGGRKGGFKGGEASLPYPSPFPLKERGIKGVR